MFAVVRAPHSGQVNVELRVTMAQKFTLRSIPAYMSATSAS